MWPKREEIDHRSVAIGFNAYQPGSYFLIWFNFNHIMDE